MLHRPADADSDTIASILASGLYVVIGIARRDAPPLLVSMNYGYSDGCIYLHSGLTGTKITAWEASPQVSFTVVAHPELISGSTACQWSMRFRSLVGQGWIDRVTEQNERIAGLNALMRHYGSELDTYSSRLMDQTAIWRVTIEQATVREMM